MTTREERIKNKFEYFANVIHGSTFLLCTICEETILSQSPQFVDVLGFFSMRSIKDEARFAAHVQEAVGVLSSQNAVLANHPNSSIYNSLSQMVDFNGYYLESDPCLVCNNPEIPYASLKLSSLKMDTKFTTTTHIVKLSGSHSISKISLRIGDLKRQKMVRTINIYYNNR